MKTIIMFLLTSYVIASVFLGSVCGVTAKNLSTDKRYTNLESMAIGSAYTLTHGTVIELAWKIVSAKLTHKNEDHSSSCTNATALPKTSWISGHYKNWQYVEGYYEVK